MPLRALKCQSIFRGVFSIVEGFLSLVFGEGSINILPREADRKLCSCWRQLQMSLLSRPLFPPVRRGSLNLCCPRIASLTNPLNVKSLSIKSVSAFQWSAALILPAPSIWNCSAWLKNICHAVAGFIFPCQRKSPRYFRYYYFSENVE